MEREGERRRRMEQPGPGGCPRAHRPPPAPRGGPRAPVTRPAPAPPPRRGPALRQPLGFSPPVPAPLGPNHLPAAAAAAGPGLHLHPTRIRAQPGGGDRLPRTRGSGRRGLARSRKAPAEATHLTRKRRRSRPGPWRSGPAWDGRQRRRGRADEDRAPGSPPRQLAAAETTEARLPQPGLTDAAAVPPM